MYQKQYAKIYTDDDLPLLLDPGSFGDPALRIAQAFDLGGAEQTGNGFGRQTSIATNADIDLHTKYNKLFTIKIFPISGHNFELKLGSASPSTFVYHPREQFSK